jgi:deoxyadenosine/deoxycytidine kinase
VIVIDGNIGVGKSTIIRRLQHRLDKVNFIAEPLEMYQSAGGRNLMQEFYQQKPGASFLFQLEALTRVNQCYMNARSMPGKTVFERGIASSIFAFSESAFHRGQLDGLEYCLLKRVSDMININRPEINDREIVIFLDLIDIDVGLERIKGRERVEERDIDRDYYKMLNHAYRFNYLNAQNHGFKKVYVVNAEQDVEDVLDEVEEIIEKV